jgi:hypothetical protein
MSVTHRPFFTPGKDAVSIVQEAGRAPGPVWRGAENLAPTRIRFPDRPARSQSLYRPRYPAHFESEVETMLLERATFLSGLKRRTRCALHHAPVIIISTNVFDFVY